MKILCSLPTASRKFSPSPGSKQGNELAARSETKPADAGGEPLNSELRTVGGSRRKQVITKEGNENLAKDDVIELEGIVTDALPNAMFSVDIGNGHTILAHISGKLRMNFIKILPGDKVTVQMSPYDLTRGRITWRSK